MPFFTKNNILMNEIRFSLKINKITDKMAICNRATDQTYGLVWQLAA
jgi:hypothetical protein